MDPKQSAAKKAVEYIENGMLVGLGTGSTASWAIKEIGERMKQGLEIKAVASSIASENLAREFGIPIMPFSAIDLIDLAIDGADEVDENRNLIKGGGGSLLREKILAYHSERFFVVVDESKLVDKLGEFPLPVEVIPFAVELTIKSITELGCEAQIRKRDDKFFITDNGNLIVDCAFTKIEDPLTLDQQLKSIPGLVETGIFYHSLVSSVIVGYADGALKEI